jgi:NADH-quinone oxidoreductase subunit J
VLFQEIVFWVLAIAGVVTALGVVLLKDIFRAALSLVLAFLSIAGVFVLLNAEFLGVVQVLIYAGAISILIIFAIMLTRDVQRGSLPNALQLPALVLCGLLLAAIVFVALNTDWPLLEEARLAAETRLALEEEVLANTPYSLAGLLLREFVLPFEVASVLLLAAIIGALALVRER